MDNFQIPCAQQTRILAHTLHNVSWLFQASIKYQGGWMDMKGFLLTYSKTEKTLQLQAVFRRLGHENSWFIEGVFSFFEQFGSNNSWPNKTNMDPTWHKRRESHGANDHGQWGKTFPGQTFTSCSDVHFIHSRKFKMKNGNELPYQRMKHKIDYL